jgi:hypothetical protein
MPITDKTTSTMKKILCGIALVLAMALATSCGCNQKKNAVVEGEAVEVVDSTAVEVAVDSLQVAE